MDFVNGVFPSTRNPTTLRSGNTYEDDLNSFQNTSKTNMLSIGRLGVVIS